MPVRLSCPGCQAPYVLPDEQRGKQMRCGKCQQVFTVPAAAGAGKPPAGNGTGHPGGKPAATAPPREERTQTRPVPVEPDDFEPEAPKATPKRSSVPCVLAVLAVLFVLCAGGLGAGGVAVAVLMLKTAPTEGPVVVVDRAEVPAPAAQRAPAVPPPVEVPKAAPPVAEPVRPPQPEPVPPKADPPAGEPEKLPLKATVNRPYRAYVPGRQPRALYQLTAGPPGIALSARGEVQWTPGKDMVGTQEFTVRVTDAGQTTTHRYQLDVQEDMAPVARPDVPRPGGVPRPAGLPEGLPKDQATLDKATVGKPFTFQFPNPDGTVKYELVAPGKQNTLGLELTPEGVLNWAPPVGTPAKPFRLLVLVGGRLQTYFIDIQENAENTLAMPAPGGWVMLPDGVTLIVSQPDKAQLVYVDTAAIKETKRVDLDFKPGPLAFQEDKLFAAAQGSSLVYVLDLATGAVKKEVKVSGGPVLALACHPRQGLLYASTGERRVLAIDPEAGTAKPTPAQGVYLAVDPVNGDALYTGIQGEIKDTIEFRDLGGGRVVLQSGRSGENALLLKYAVKGDTLTPVGANDNAATNGACLRVSPDGKKVGIPGGGGYRPKSGGAGKGYAVALFGTDDVKSLAGIVECGAYPQNLAFHPVLDLGIVDQSGSTLHLFNSKSLVEVGTIPFVPEPPPPGPRSDLLTFGARGTKVVYHDRHGGGAYLRFLPLTLSDKDREALEKAYGK
jgi:predicted Zn finger-like uncharacterized protein